MNPGEDDLQVIAKIFVDRGYNKTATFVRPDEVDDNKW
jgi:hypothetical protein